MDNLLFDRILRSDSPSLDDLDALNALGVSGFAQLAERAASLSKSAAAPVRLATEEELDALRRASRPKSSLIDDIRFRFRLACEGAGSFTPCRSGGVTTHVERDAEGRFVSAGITPAFGFSVMQRIGGKVELVPAPVGF
jgi:hypothetical protein